MDTQRSRTRLCTYLHSISSTFDTTMVQPRIVHATESRHASGVGRRDAAKERHRSSQQSNFPRILLSRIPRDQEEREVPTCHQSTSPQSIDRGTYLQDGDSSIDLSSSSSGRLGYVAGSHGRILPRADSTVVPKVPEIRDQRHSIPVPRPSVWASNCTTNLHEDARTDGYSSPLHGHLSSPLHRRHPGQSDFERSTTILDHHSHQHVDDYGIQDQPAQVYVRTYTRLCLHRSQISNGPGPYETSRRQDQQDPRPNPRDKGFGSSSSQSVVLATRTSGLGRETSTSRSSTHTTTSGLPPFAVPMGSSSTGVSSSPRQQMLLSPRVVVGSTERLQRSNPGTVQPRPHSIHRRLIDELGSPCRRSTILGPLVPQRIVEIDQPTRTVGSHSSSTGSTSQLGQHEDHGSLRQLINGCLHQQDGRNSKSSDVRTDASTVPSGSVTFSHSSSQTHTRSPQQTSRHLVESETDSRHRVDTVNAHMQTSPISMGISHGRPDGHVSDHSTSSLRVSLPRRSSSSGRRNIIRLDRTGRLHLSTMANDCASSSEAQTQSLRCDSDSSMLAESTMVSRSTRPADRVSQKTPSTSRSAFHASQSTTTRKRRSTCSARVQTIVDSALDQGFSQAVSERIARGRHVNSTQVIYDSKWNKFENWCGDRKISPSSTSLGELANFLLYLFNELKLSYSTICGYRSSINSVWRATGRKDVESHAIHQLLDTFKVDRPRSMVILPKWDLALVLRVLSQPPYEPIGSIDFKNLSAKTVFLLLLATSRRKGDIHAIDPKRVTFATNASGRMTHVILEPLPGYIPKVRANAEREARYQPMIVRSLSSITRDEAELTLCPVRALLAYDRIAKERFPDRPQFFVSTKSGKKVVNKNTISAWVVKLLRAAYTSASEQDCRLSQTSVHEVRAIAASLAYQATYALNDILSAATWASPTTFTDHYLRDVSGLQGRLHVLAPCVVAGKTLH